MQLTQPPLPKLLEKLKSSFLPHVSHYNILLGKNNWQSIASITTPILLCRHNKNRQDGLEFNLVKCHEDQDILLND